MPAAVCRQRPRDASARAGSIAPDAGDVALDNTAPPAIRSGAVAVELQAERRRAYDHVARAMGSRRFRHLLVDLLCWIECGTWLKRRDAAAKQPVRSHANSELDRRHRK